MYKEYNCGYGITELLCAWDGNTSESWHRFPVERDAFPLLVNKDGDIFYQTKDGRAAVWCRRDRLGKHLHRLYQLGIIT